MFFIVSLRKESWEVIKNNNFSFIDFPERYIKSISNLKKNSKIIIYIGSRISEFKAILEVTDDIIYDNKEWIWDSIYNKRKKTKLLFLLKHGVKVSEIITELSFVKNKDINYGSYFQHPIRKIDLQTYTYIINYMKNNQTMDK